MANQPWHAADTAFTDSLTRRLAMSDVHAHFTDAVLTADLDATTRGSVRRAQLLLRVPFAWRAAIEQDAWFERSHLGGRLNDLLEDAVVRFERYGAESYPFASEHARALVAR